MSSIRPKQGNKDNLMAFSMRAIVSQRVNKVESRRILISIQKTMSGIINWKCKSLEFLIISIDYAKHFPFMKINLWLNSISNWISKSLWNKRKNRKWVSKKFEIDCIKLIIFKKLTQICSNPKDRILVFSTLTFKMFKKMLKTC